MSEFTEGFAEALAELEDPDLVPSTFTWPSASGQTAVLTDAPCFVSGATKGAKLEEYGFGVIADVVVIIRRGLFGDALPSRGQTFTANGQAYRIDMILKPVENPFIRIAGVSQARGA